MCIADVFDESTPYEMTYCTMKVGRTQFFFAPNAHTAVEHSLLISFRDSNSLRTLLSALTVDALFVAAVETVGRTVCEACRSCWSVVGGRTSAGNPQPSSHAPAVEVVHSMLTVVSFCHRAEASHGWHFCTDDRRIRLQGLTVQFWPSSDRQPARASSVRDRRWPSRARGSV